MYSEILRALHTLHTERYYISCTKITTVVYDCRTSDHCSADNYLKWTYHETREILATAL